LDPPPVAGDHERVLSPPGFDVLSDLEARALVYDSTDREALARLLAEPPVSVYCGFDPTADSLHAGNLLGILVLRRLQLAGHRPIALAGGATGMIGDPGGRSQERNLLEADVLGANLAAITAQLGRLLDFESGANPALLVDNAAWTADLRLLAFLRDVGKHVTVNQMLAKESVRTRVETTSGISFTEFSYMLIQAHDYLWLHEHEGCDLQIGGSDQWGNITAGVDLVRRRTGHRVHGLTWPLLTKADGTKFGKSAGGSIWLDPVRTSPYAFYQHWMQVDDADVRRFLLQLTLLSVEEADAVAAVHVEAPGRRAGQRRLAFEVTALVHGAHEAVAAQAATEVLFGQHEGAVPEGAFRALEGELTTTAIQPRLLEEGIEVEELLVTTGLSPSRSDARRQLAQGAVYVNGQRCDRADAEVTTVDLHHQRWILLRRGKREHRLLRVDDADSRG
jgi:tyrosyl-tRNA synthetase